jgi:hypothetical protein
VLTCPPSLAAVAGDPSANVELLGGDLFTFVGGRAVSTGPCRAVGAPPLHATRPVVQGECAGRVLSHPPPRCCQIVGESDDEATGFERCSG